MKRHKKTSGTKQPKGRQIRIIPHWFMRPYLVLLEVWEGDIEHAAMVVPVEIWKDKPQIMATIERLLGGKIVSIITLPPDERN